ncbi:MAG: T9SS type A sorting domain-containing protein [Bacteroidales bacterium]|nr:T9SS type A sorting domain-containing protein [Bacteroidales bacterium]
MKKTLLLLASLFLAYNYSYSQEKVFGMYFNDSTNWKLYDTISEAIMPSDPSYSLVEIKDHKLHLFADQGTGCAKVKASYQIYNDFLENGVHYALKVSFSEIYVNELRFQFSLNNRQFSTPFQWYNFPNGLNFQILVKDSFEILSQPETVFPIGLDQLFVEKSDSFKLEFYVDACRADLWSYADIFVDTIEIWKIPYQSVFGATSTSWNLYHEIPDAGWTDSLVVTRDTTIHGLAYKEVLNTVVRMGTEQYYLRESGDRSKVYLYVPEIADEEFPVMDLTLALADTFYMGTDRSDTLIVDSVYTADGRKHIRFDYPIEITGRTEKLEFIEGVGTNFGLFYQGIPSMLTPPSQYLLCAYHNGSQVFSNKSMNGQCSIHWVGINDQAAAREIKMYPNPAHDKLTIELPGNQFTGTCRLLVYNSSGCLIETLEGSSSPITVNVQDKPAGIYLIRLNHGNKLYNLRFVVNK